MTTLVTGAAGFIGGHVVRALQALGESVVGLDIRPRDDSYVCDIRDPQCVMDVLGVVQPTVVIHLAARVGVRDSVNDPAGYVATNVAGTLNILDACVKTGVSQIVMASTSSVYGHLAHQVETALPQPLSPYAATKLGMEALAQVYAHLYGLNIAVLRLFSVYGEGVRPDLMISRVMDALIGGDVITCFSSNGRAMARDWTYVGDVASAVRAARSIKGFEVINVGRGESVPLNGMIERLEAVSGLHAHTTNVPAPATEPQQTRADILKARALLNYDPTVTIDEGLRRTWDWYLQAHLASA